MPSLVFGLEIDWIHSKRILVQKPDVAKDINQHELVLLLLVGELRVFNHPLKHWFWVQQLFLMEMNNSILFEDM